MPALTVTARFPLGHYQGHREDASSDPFPDTARLYSALIGAASKGTLAVDREGDLRMSAEVAETLAWMESHPPTALTVPDHRPVRVGPPRIAYRAEGVFDGRNLTERKVAKPLSTARVIGERVGWHWKEAPEAVIRTIGELCADVPSLGESDSPVILEVAPLPPTHVLDESAGQLSGRGIRVRTPEPGRLASLEQAYDRAYAPRTRKAKAAWSKSELPNPLPVEQSGLTARTYVSHTEAPPTVPWQSVRLLVLDRPIPTEWRVQWCVAVHRMLAARLGDTAPASVTGKYTTPVRPANRVAVQYFPAGTLAHQGISEAAFGLLYPHGMEALDRLEINRALIGRLAVYRRDRRVPLRDGGELPCHDFWPEVREGWKRQWRPAPALVAETRRQGPDWTFADAALLSVGFVFRDEFGTERRGQAGYRDVVEQVRAAGVSITDVHQVSDQQVAKYVHKVPAGLGVVQPYRATLDLSGVSGSRTLLALGQSRHLGGGLLMPMDVLEEA